MKSFNAAALLSFILAANAGTIVWDGNFDYYNSASDFDNWSWSNQVGEYQWYIHGSSATTSYLALDSSYKNPADTRESKGLKMTVDSTSHWNGQSMMRTELIPQSSANLGTGQMYYHFSIKHEATNPPGTSEHQIFFFESHFTELKVGIGSDLTKLNWCISGTSQWTTDFVAGTWYNFAYDIDFSGNTVGLWFSTGSNPLTKVVANKSVSTYTNSADFHVGVLRLGDSSTEDWYVSCVYIESGSINANHCSGSSPPPSSTTPASSSTSTSRTSSTSSTRSSSTSSVRSSTSTTSSRISSTSTTSSTRTSSTSSTTSTTSSATGAVQTHWGQCGGIGWTGPTACVSGTTCTKLNDWYYQCL